MLIRNSDGMAQRTIRLKPGYTEDEIGPFGRNAKRFESGGRDMIGFSIELAPFYDTDHDPRLKSDKNLKLEIENLIKTHPNFGKTFGIWDLKKEKTEITIGKLQDLETQIASLKKRDEKAELLEREMKSKQRAALERIKELEAQLAEKDGKAKV